MNAVYSLAALVIRYVLAFLLVLLLVRLVLMMRYERRVSRRAVMQGLPIASYHGMLVRCDRKADSRYGLAADNMIGRSKRCDVVIRDSSMAPIHAQIYLRESGYHLYGFDKRSRIWVNGQLSQGRVPLRHGDEISLGDVKLKIFLFQNESDEPLFGQDDAN